MTDKPILRRLSGRLFLLLLLAALMRPAVGETIQLERSEHGTYTISVQINGALVLPFVLDTGASLVVIPEDVFRTLTRTGTVTKSDFIGAGTAVLADGSKHASDSYVLHEVQVGDHIVRNVVASVVSVNGAALLGQSFLSKLPAWSIDNTRQAHVIADGAGATQSTPAAPTTTPVSPALIQYGAIAWDEGTGKRGWSLNQDKPQRAAEVVLGACGTAGCKVIVRTGPAMCSAMAATEDGKYIGVASRADRIEALLSALTNCQKGNAGECPVQLTTCNQ
jgi:clan AA aspartic protease (TIGR02281 family)